MIHPIERVRVVGEEKVRVACWAVLYICMMEGWDRAGIEFIFDSY